MADKVVISYVKGGGFFDCSDKITVNIRMMIKTVMETFQGSTK